MSPNHANPATGLAAELAAWQALLDTLGEEERILVEGDAERLAALGVVKLERLQTASEFARARLDALRAAGYAADAVGMEGWMAQHAAPPQRALWQNLAALENEARNCNQRIGKLIDMRLAATRQSLNVLVRAASGRNGLYDQAGQTVASLGGKTLTAA